MYLEFEALSSGYTKYSHNFSVVVHNLCEDGKYLVSWFVILTAYLYDILCKLYEYHLLKSILLHDHVKTSDLIHKKWDEQIYNGINLNLLFPLCCLFYQLISNHVKSAILISISYSYNLLVNKFVNDPTIPLWK